MYSVYGNVPGLKFSVAKKVAKFYMEEYLYMYKLLLSAAEERHLWMLSHLGYSGKIMIWIVLENFFYTCIYFIQCMQLICFYLDIKLFLIE